MEKIKSFVTWLLGKPWYTILGIGLAGTALAVVLSFSSCSSFRGASIGGYHKVDKNVKDSLHYESSWSK